MAHLFGTGTGFGGGRGDSGPGDTPQFGKPASAPSPTSQHVGHSASASIGDCHYFLQGNCTKGDNCLFRHSHAAKANGVVCRFWQNGFCKDANNCPFQHPAGAGRGHGHGRAGTGNWFASGRGMGGMRGAFSGGRGSSRAPLEAVDRSKQSCVFFFQGKCTKGDACPFSHASPLNDGTGQAVSRGIGPDKEQYRAGIQREHTKPVFEQPFEALSIGRNDGMHEQMKDGETNGTVAFRGAAVRSNEERAPGVRMSGANPLPPTDVEVGPGPFSAGPPVVIGGDGKTYVVGPEGLVPLDAVMRTMASTSKENSTSTPSSTPPNPTTVEPCQRSTLNDSNDRARVTVASKPSQSQTLDKAPGKSGIITLPDGGFVTRKRAAKMKLLGNIYGEKDFKCVRERNAQEQPRQERRLEKTEGRVTVQAGGRPSIMDRLGPARQPPGTATSAEKVVAPPRTRSEAPGQPAKMREEPRQQSTLVDRLRDGSQVNRPFPLSRPKALGTARPTRRLDESAGQTALPRKPTVARPTINHDSASLDFKVPTLDEIKSRKRKAEEARVEATAKKTTKVGKVAGGTDTRSTGSEVAEGTDVPSANVDSSHEDAVVPNASVAQEEVSDAAPTVGVSSDALQLEADMLEFQEWL